MNDQLVRLGMIDLNAERAQRVNGVKTIVALEETAQRANTVRQSSDYCGSMRNTFVTRNGDFGINPRRSLCPQFHK
jgi:hypothetical protein